MTADQRELILQLITNTIGEGDFLYRFGYDLRSDPGIVVELLETAIDDRSADDAEFGMSLAYYFGLSERFVPTLNKLLNEPWHCAHEDVARALQLLHDPRSVDSLYRAALTEFDYRSYDENYGLARECTWALADIGTPEALEKLSLLAANRNPKIAAYAQKRLSHPRATPN